MLVDRRFKVRVKEIALRGPPSNKIYVRIREYQSSWKVCRRNYNEWQCRDSNN